MFTKIVIRKFSFDKFIFSNLSNKITRVTNKLTRKVYECSVNPDSKCKIIGVFFFFLIFIRSKIDFSIILREHPIELGIVTDNLPVQIKSLCQSSPTWVQRIFTDTKNVIHFKCCAHLLVLAFKIGLKLKMTCHIFWQLPKRLFLC